tara:strand:+ start:156 stop:602 length:447 start_codon:yes stop_codon:yes gene_type:complete
MAGGISGTAIWQDRMTELITMVYNDVKPAIDLTVLNPRQLNYEDTTISAKRQIEWEYKHLAQCSALMFWFPPETVCPITLFELGKWIRSRFLFVGCDPEYSRIFDLRVQLGLERPDVGIVYSMEELSDQIRWWLVNIKHYHKIDHGKK